MATRLNPTNFGYQNFFSTTLTADITSGSLTLNLAAVPTPSSGILVIEPDSSTAREVVLYTSKGASTVTIPSDGRGYSGSTAAAHLSGSAVVMAPVDKWFTALASGELSTDPLRTELFPDFLASGCVITGDAYASTRNASMTSGVIYIAGRRLTVASVSAHSYTASKDTYVDASDNGDGTALLTYNEVTNGAASPALASNNIRLAKVVTGATNIAAASSITQFGSDSLGNRIYPQAYERLKVLRQDDTTNTAQTKSVILTGWGVITVGAANSATEAITFGETFLQRPIVVASFGGDAASATTYGSGGSTVKANVAMTTHTVTTTGFTVRIITTDSSNWGAGNTVFYQWMAIGEVLI